MESLVILRVSLMVGDFGTARHRSDRRRERHPAVGADLGRRGSGRSPRSPPSSSLTFDMPPFALAVSWSTSLAPLNLAMTVPTWVGEQIFGQLMLLLSLTPVKLPRAEVSAPVRPAWVHAGGGGGTGRAVAAGHRHRRPPCCPAPFTVVPLSATLSLHAATPPMSVAAVARLAARRLQAGARLEGSRSAPRCQCRPGLGRRSGRRSPVFDAVGDVRVFPRSARRDLDALEAHPVGGGAGVELLDPRQ